MAYIKIGKMINTHGIHGEIKIQSCSDFDQERYTPGNTVYLLYQGEYKPLKVKSYRVHKGFPLVAFEGLENINDVEIYKECGLYVEDSQRSPLQDGRHYVSELEGMHVIDEEGHLLGTVTSIEETLGANRNMRIVKTDGKEALIPYVPAFIRNVNSEERTITIHVIGGLL